MDFPELLFIAFEAFLAGICWTFGGMLAEAIADRFFPPDDEDPPQDPPKAQPPHRAPKRKPKHYGRAFAALPALAIVLSGCASPSCAGCTRENYREKVPNYPEVEVTCRMATGCEIWEPAKVSKALDHWFIFMGDWFDISPVLPTQIIIEGRADLGAAGPNVPKTAGKSLNDSTIQIAGLFLYGLTPRPMGRSAFSHELLHIALWHLDAKDPDYNHAEPPGPWTKYHDQMLDEYDAVLLKMFPESDAGPAEDMSHE